VFDIRQAGGVEQVHGQAAFGEPALGAVDQAAVGADEKWRRQSSK
jgi:hypothetical protein